MRLSYILLLLVLCLASGCDERVRPAPQNLAEAKLHLIGVYQGKYNNGIERFTFNEDGSFSQVFTQTNTVIYESQGRWTLEEKTEGYTLSLAPFMDLEEAIINYGGPAEGGRTRRAAFYGDDDSVWFFRDLHYFIKKVKSDPNNRPSKQLENR